MIWHENRERNFTRVTKLQFLNVHWWDDRKWETKQPFGGSEVELASTIGWLARRTTLPRNTHNEQNINFAVYELRALRFRNVNTTLCTQYTHVCRLYAIFFFVNKEEWRGGERSENISIKKKDSKKRRVEIRRYIKITLYYKKKVSVTAKWPGVS